MRKELDEKLCAEFPKLYRHRNKSPMETCMCWGFPGDGWYNIIYDLSKELEPLIEQHERKYSKDDFYIAASQVKEKFGTLRYYMTSQTEKMGWLIRIAEYRSFYTCEECGSEDAKTRRLGWILTLCDKCYFEVLGKKLEKKTANEIASSLIYYFGTKSKETTRRKDRSINWKHLRWRIKFVFNKYFWKGLYRDTTHWVWIQKRRMQGKRVR